MITRRAVLAGAAGLAAPERRKRRRLVGWRIPVITVNEVIIEGPGGTFTYDAAGNLRSANVAQTIPDPIQGITCYAGFSTFNGHGAVISLFSSTLDVQLWYADTGSSTQGALTCSVANSGSGTDPFGNAFLANQVTYFVVAGHFFALSHGGISFSWFTAPSAAGPYTLASGLFMNPASTPADVLTIAAGANPVLIVSGTAGANPVTSALLEVQGDVQAGDGLSIGQGAAVQTLVNGSTISSAGITMQPVTAAAAVTGIILQAGTFDGQVIAVPSNAGVGNTITFAATATSHVALGTGAVINPGACAIFVWVASTSLWYLSE